MSQLQNSLDDCQAETPQCTSQYSKGDKTNNDSHNPVLSEIAKLNGKINRMSTLEIQKRLNHHNLDTRGKKDVLKKRLKSFYKRKRLSMANIKDPNSIVHHYKYLVVIDFEATCDVGQPHSYRQEIIEFPAVLVSTKKKEIFDEFHSYVRPYINPKLSTFCMSLTGIQQEMVNRAPHFPQVLIKFEEWLKQHNLSCESNNFSVVSDGPWDMGRFLVEQCKISDLPFPEWGKKWINIRKTYSNFYDTKRICLKEMLQRLGMRFEGKPHSGIDDSRNIARIVLMLLKDGANLRVNEKLKESTMCVENVTRKEFEESHFRKRHPTKEVVTSSPVKCFKPKKDEKDDRSSLTSIDMDYFQNLNPPIPRMNDVDFPLLSSTNRKFSSLTIH